MTVTVTVLTNSVGVDLIGMGGVGLPPPLISSVSITHVIGDGLASPLIPKCLAGCLAVGSVGQYGGREGHPEDERLGELVQMPRAVPNDDSAS